MSCHLRNQNDGLDHLFEIIKRNRNVCEEGVRVEMLDECGGHSADRFLRKFNKFGIVCAYVEFVYILSNIIVGSDWFALDISENFESSFIFLLLPLLFLEELVLCFDSGLLRYVNFTSFRRSVSCDLARSLS